MASERPPQRPGAGGPSGPPGRDDDWSDRPGDVPGEDVPLDVQGLAQLLLNVSEAVSAAWEQVDPRPGKPDRYNRATGGDDGALGEFFSRATMLLGTMTFMVEELIDSQDAEDAADGDQAAAQRFSDATVNDPKNGPRWLDQMITVLGRAGVEVDEADVLSWDVFQRNDAYQWAACQAQVDAEVIPKNPLPYPSFLPEARDGHG